jgi:hypothetical protein
MGNSFGWALDRLWEGSRVCRAGWNGKGMYLELQRPDRNSEMSDPYLYIKLVNRHFVPWTAAQPDMLSFDWEIAD